MEREKALHHARSVKKSLEAIEAHPALKTDRALRGLIYNHHKSLQSLLEDAGETLGLTADDVIVFGGGTPKTPEDEK